MGMRREYNTLDVPMVAVTQDVHTALVKKVEEMRRKGKKYRVTFDDVLRQMLNLPENRWYKRGE